MSLKLEILQLSERVKWKNWPSWLKGLFLFWPSLGPAYLFITRTPVPTEVPAEANTLLSNLEYQNYFISVFIGFWSINLLILGLVWIVGTLISDGYRNHLRRKHEVLETKKVVELAVMKRRKPTLSKKGISFDSSGPDSMK